MLKKFKVYMLAVSMMFGIFVFMGCETTNNLADCKSIAKVEIQTYALEKILNNEYTAEKLIEIAKAVMESKEAVEIAIDKTGVDMAVSNAKEKVSMIEKDEEMGTNKSQLPTIEDDFKDDRVLVVLKQQYSKVNGEVKLEDFGINAEKIGLGKITDLFTINDPEESKSLNGQFFQILSIELIEKGKDKVLEAIVELLKSEIVQFVEPDYNYFIQTHDVLPNNIKGISAK